MEEYISKRTSYKWIDLYYPNTIDDIIGYKSQIKVSNIGYLCILKIKK